MNIFLITLCVYNFFSPPTNVGFKNLLSLKVKLDFEFLFGFVSSFKQKNVMYVVIMEIIECVTFLKPYYFCR